MGGPNKIPIGTRLTQFPGRSFNLLVDEWYRQRGKLPRETKTTSGPGQTLIVKARNTTGEALNYGNCVAIEGLAIAYEDQENQNYRRPLVKAQKHTGSLHHSIMGVALTPIEDDQPGPFIAVGTAWVRCNFTDENHHFAKLPDEQEDLLAESSTSGYPILDSEEIPGELPAELWALVLLGGGGGGGGPGTIRFARVTTEIPPATGNLTADWGTGGQVKYQDDSTGELDSSATLVKNKLIGVRFPVDSQVEVADGDIVVNGTCHPVVWPS